MSFESKLAVLKSELRCLTSDLESFQYQHQTLSLEQNQKCSDALSQSVAQLSAVVTYVNKVDHNLVYWYEKSHTIKSALRFIGVNKRTEAIIERRTSKIQDKISRMETSFQDSGDVVKSSLTAFQDFNRQVTHYSLSRVSAAQYETTKLESVIDENLEATKLLISRTEVETCHTSDEIGGTTAAKREAETARRNAQARSDSSANVSAFGFAGAVCAGLASFAFPPALVVAGPALAFGIGNAVESSSYTDQANSLEAKGYELERKLRELRVRSEELESRMSGLSEQKTAFLEVKSTIESLFQCCITLRKGSQTILDDLLAAQIAMSNLIIKIEQISAQLADCGYAFMRRDIATKLNMAVQDCRSMSSSGFDISETPKFRNTLEGVQKMESNTLVVLAILAVR